MAPGLKLLSREPTVISLTMIHKFLGTVLEKTTVGLTNRMTKSFHTPTMHNLFTVTVTICMSLGLQESATNIKYTMTVVLHHHSKALHSSLDTGLAIRIYTINYDSNNPIFRPNLFQKLLNDYFLNVPHNVLLLTAVSQCLH